MHGLSENPAASCSTGAMRWPPPCLLMGLDQLADQYRPLDGQAPMLRIEAIPGVDQLVDIQTQVRHTTVIVLPEKENDPRFRCRGFRILASDRRGECGVPETDCNGCGNQRRADLRVRTDLFVPRIRGRGASPGRSDRAAARRGRRTDIGRAPYPRLHCTFPSHGLSSTWPNRPRRRPVTAQLAADTLDR